MVKLHPTRPGRPVHDSRIAESPNRRGAHFGRIAESRGAAPRFGAIRTTLDVRRRTRPEPGRAHVEWSPGPDQTNISPSGPAESRLVGQHGVVVEVDTAALRYLYHGGFGLSWVFFRPQTRMSPAFLDPTI
jgi:hypothetical protein